MTARRRSVAVVLAAMLLSADPAAAADFLVFPLTAKLPVRMVVVGQAVDQVVSAALKEKDLVNLALGRPLGTKVDTKTEVLALALTAEPPSTSPLAKVIVFDPTATGSSRIVTTVAQVATLAFETAPLKGGVQGQGTLTADVRETVLGDPAHDALHATTLYATGTGKASAFVPPGLDLGLTLKLVVGGRIGFTASRGAPVGTFAGFVVNGKAQASGKPIGSFSE